MYNNNNIIPCNQNQVMQLDIAGVRKLLDNIKQNILYLTKVSTTQLETQFIDADNSCNTVLCVIISELPNILENIEFTKRYINYDNILADFIKKISDQALNTVNGYGKSALDYLLEYSQFADEEGKVNALTKLQNIINSDDSCFDGLLKIIGENIFKFDANNWPVLSYFTSEQLQKAGVNTYINDNTRELIRDYLINTYDLDYDGLAEFMESYRDGEDHTKFPIILEFMKSKGANINSKTPLDIICLHKAAAVSDCQNIIQTLIDEHANINKQDREGCTPLHNAAAFGIKDNVEVLINNGANIIMANNIGNNPLHVCLLNASQIEYTEDIENIVKLLIEAAKKINIINELINTQNNHGDTSLHFAIKYCWPKIVKLLIEAGATVDTQNNDGNTPLHLAVIDENLEEDEDTNNEDAEEEDEDMNDQSDKEDEDIDDEADEDDDKDINNEDNDEVDEDVEQSFIELLIKAKAIVNIPNNKGKTALNLASDNENPELIHLVSQGKYNLNFANNQGTASPYQAIENADENEDEDENEDKYEYEVDTVGMQNNESRTILNANKPNIAYLLNTPYENSASSSISSINNNLVEVKIEPVSPSHNPASLGTPNNADLSLQGSSSPETEEQGLTYEEAAFILLGINLN